MGQLRIMLDQLIQEYQDAQRKANEAFSKLNDYQDGLIYLTCLRCYGSLSWEQHTNEFVVQQLCDEYYGDNGIVDVLTNNPSHSISSYCDVETMSLEQIKELPQDNISMSRAVCNWISHL
jgi:hypothetical protein